MCGGQAQTPINFKHSELVRENVEFPWFSNQHKLNNNGCRDFNMFSDDHSWEVSFKDGSCTKLAAVWQGETYYLQQMHFHFGSEHTVGSGQHDGEVHMVHKNLDQTKAFVIGVFLDYSPVVLSNDFLGQFYDIYYEQFVLNSQGDTWEVYLANEVEVRNYNKMHGQTEGPSINPYNDFMPTDWDFWHYTGSLTTYPCSEGVEWFVMKQPITVGINDIKMIGSAIHNNIHTIVPVRRDNEASTDMVGFEYRPIQETNGRVVYSSGDTYAKPEYLKTHLRQ